jgi:hypothetical protein
LRAVDALLAWQLASRPGVLPPYDEALLGRELSLFPDWYLQKHRALELPARMRETLDAQFRLIVQRNLASPSVYVHRDFMPRNLMLPRDPAEPRLGVLDFQDAVYGPITYDIACLMRDAFLSWDEEFVLDITVRYWEKALKAGLPVDRDFGEFYRAVEWMGLQRHLKVAGIFARLTLRDGKPKYLADAPRFISYIRTATHRYRELAPLARLIDEVEAATRWPGTPSGACSRRAARPLRRAPGQRRHVRIAGGRGPPCPGAAAAARRCADPVRRPRRRIRGAGHPHGPQRGAGAGRRAPRHRARNGGRRPPRGRHAGQRADGLAGGKGHRAGRRVGPAAGE